MKALINFLKFCSEERNVQMFKAGARAGSETVISLADDLHTVSKLAVGSKEGAGLALLRAMFPTTAVTVERNVRRIEELEEKLFPTLPENGCAYKAKVIKPVLLDEGGTEGYWCVIPMRPPFHFNVPCPHSEDHPEELNVRCLEKDDDAWKLLDDDELDETLIIEYI